MKTFAQTIDGLLANLAFGETQDEALAAVIALHTPKGF